MQVFFKNIPTYNNDTDTWDTTSFPDQYHFGQFLQENCFKEPSQYNFDESVQKISTLARFWEKNKYYTDLPEGTSDWHKFWKDEEKKSRLGVLFKSNGKIWYFTRDYYFFLNFCPIINKEKGQNETMASLRDVQYHMMLYEKLAEIYHLHSAIIKRRQMLFSFCHAAKSVNILIFENKKTIKWFASDESFINDVNGSWKFLNAYLNHISLYTPWEKVFTPSTFPELQQVEKIKQRGSNKWLTDGNESTLVAKTLNKDPKKGVGGPATWIWYEEGGIAPTADETLTFLNPALESGMERVGSFCIGGSVGDLKQCKPLKEFILDPTLHGFFGVPTKWFDETGIEKVCGLFIPAQYGMPEATDEFGNSQVEKALELLHKAEFIGFKKGENGRIQDEPAWVNLPEKQYIIKKSQSPKNIKEAFAYREESYFPIKKLEKQQNFIKDNPEKQPTRVILSEDKEGNIKWEATENQDISYPVDMKALDKQGVTLMWKKPEKNIEWMTNFGGVDNVEVGQTQTSESLFSIYIVESTVEETYYTESGEERIRITGGGLLASWTGRYNDIDDTNRQGEYLIRLYKAYTLCERNKPNFITHMIKKGYRTYLATEGDVPMFKEADEVIDPSKNNQIGVYMDSSGKKHKMCDEYLYQWLVSELDAIYKMDTDGNPTDQKVKTYLRLDYIYDYWLLEELKNDKENTDRRDALRLAITLMLIQDAKGRRKKRINTEHKPEKKKIDRITRNVNLLRDNNHVNYNGKGIASRPFNSLR